MTGKYKILIKFKVRYTGKDIERIRVETLELKLNQKSKSCKFDSIENTWYNKNAKCEDFEHDSMRRPLPNCDER